MKVPPHILDLPSPSSPSEFMTWYKALKKRYGRTKANFIFAKAIGSYANKDVILKDKGFKDFIKDNNIPLSLEESEATAMFQELADTLVSSVKIIIVVGSIGVLVYFLLPRLLPALIKSFKSVK